MNSHPQRVIIKRNWTSIMQPCYDSRKFNFSILSALYATWLGCKERRASLLGLVSGESPRSYTVSYTSSTEQFIVIFQDFSLTSDLFMTASSSALVLVITTTSIVTQSHICKLSLIVLYAVGVKPGSLYCLLTHHSSNVKYWVQFFWILNAIFMLKKVN